MILLATTTRNIILIVAASLAVLIAVFFLFRHFVFSRRKARKSVHELERRYEYLHALLIGQDAQYIKRLEIISQSNLLYAQIHDEFFARFQIILESTDLQARIAVSLLEEMLQEKRFHEFKSAYDKNRRIVELFEAQVNELHQALMAKLRPEDECRNASLALKEKLRIIKSAYFEKQAELMTIEETFSRAFSGIENQFGEYEKFVESAFYEEANALLPSIAKMLDELAYALEELPVLCVLIDTTLPDKIAELQDSYNEMKNLNIPLHHLHVNACLSQMTNELYEMQGKLANFELKGVKERLQAMIDQIDLFAQLFVKEKEASLVFEQECEPVYEHVNQVERSFLVLRQRLLKVKEVYRIEDTYVDQIDNIQKKINDLGIIKRQLDTYIHASTKQPYSMLLDKMKELDTSVNAVEQDIANYNLYVDSLRVDSDNAFNLVNDAYLQLKQTEKTVRDLGVPPYARRLEDRFRQCYEYLDKIYDVLLISPIDVRSVNVLVSAFKQVFHVLVDEVKEQASLCEQAENAIVLANQDRYLVADYDKILTRAERFFADGDFEKAFGEASAVLKKMSIQND